MSKRGKIEGYCDHPDDLRRMVEAKIKFGTVYADPPWRYSNTSTRGAAKNHYDTMSLADLCAMPIRQLVTEDAHLHMWTTNAFLFDCPKIFEAWGFEFRSSMVWCKHQMGIGNYWRNSHEILLTAVRGKATRFNARNLKSWIATDRYEHSSKPEIIRQMITRASPGPYLELFSRCGVNLPSWTFWGMKGQFDVGLLSQRADLL